MRFSSFGINTRCSFAREKRREKREKLFFLSVTGCLFFRNVIGTRVGFALFFVFIHLLQFTYSGNEFVCSPELKDISDVNEYGAGDWVGIDPLILAIANLNILKNNLSLVINTTYLKIYIYIYFLTQNIQNELITNVAR